MSIFTTHIKHPPYPPRRWVSVNNGRKKGSYQSMLILWIGKGARLYVNQHPKANRYFFRVQLKSPTWTNPNASAAPLDINNTRVQSHEAARLHWWLCNVSRQTVSTANQRYCSRESLEKPASPEARCFPERAVILAGIAIEARSFKPDNSRRSFPPVWPVSTAFVRTPWNRLTGEAHDRGG